MYQPYSPVAVAATREVTTAMHQLPVPITLFNSASAGVVSVADLLSSRFPVELTQSGALLSVAGYTPIQGFAVFVQGVRHAPSADARTVYVPPSGVVEVAPAF